MSDSDPLGSQILRPVPREIDFDPEASTVPAFGDRVGHVFWATSRELPLSLAAKLSKRLEVAALLYAFAYTVEQAVTMILRREPPGLTVNQLTYASAVVVSLATFLLARSARLGVGAKLNLATLYLVLGAIGITFDDFWRTLSQSPGVAEITWLRVWIVSYPLLVPTPPRRLLAASLVAVTMAPAAMLAAVFLGHRPLPPFEVTFPIFLGDYLCIVLAYIGSRLIYDLGKDVSRAQLMGSYRLERRLGGGGMGDVWLARHSLLAFPAAIKVIRPAVLAGSSERDEEVQKRFMREAKATAGLTSPHSVRLFDFGLAEGGTFYYVMELLRGLDLRSLVARHGPVPPDRTVFILEQICHSLADAHSQGLIHRDIKPANVYLCRLGLESDFVKVLDFGLVARNPDDSNDTEITRKNTTPGTPAYMAPELILHNRPVDGRADLYSLGCLGYWLLTGCQIFTGATPMEILVHHARTEPPRPSARSPFAVPGELDDLILRCLAKSPEGRPPSALAMGSELRAIRFDPPWSSERAGEWWRLVEAGDEPTVLSI